MVGFQYPQAARRPFVEIVKKRQYTDRRARQTRHEHQRLLQKTPPASNIPDRPASPPTKGPAFRDWLWDPDHHRRQSLLEPEHPTSSTFL